MKPIKVPLTIRNPDEFMLGMLLNAVVTQFWVMVAFHEARGVNVDADDVWLGIANRSFDAVLERFPQRSESAEDVLAVRDEVIELLVQMHKKPGGSRSEWIN